MMASRNEQSPSPFHSSSNVVTAMVAAACAGVAVVAMAAKVTSSAMANQRECV
jgi:hypothetical protein